MIKINMFSQAESVAGQGVGSAYRELINMLSKHFSDQLDIRINEYQPSDITHYHTINFPYYLSALNSRRRGVKVGYVHFLPHTLDGSIKLVKPARFLLHQYLLAFYRAMDKLVVVNPIFGQELVDQYGFDPDKIEYIPNFVSKDTFFPMPGQAKANFRQELGYKDSDFIVLGVGQIQKRKGIDDFIALAHRYPDIQFLWVGGFSFGKITDGYEDYKKVYDNPPANLRFAGIVDRSLMNSYYNIADVFLLPSYNELFPMAILEAFSAHTPVMLRDLDLYHAIIEDYYIPAKDSDDMGRQLAHMKANPVQLQAYKDLAKQGSEFYSEDRVAQLWLDFYQSLIK